MMVDRPKKIQRPIKNQVHWCGSGGVVRLLALDMQIIASAVRVNGGSYKKSLSAHRITLLKELKGLQDA
jgi:hypothetical protein